MRWYKGQEGVEGTFFGWRSRAREREEGGEEEGERKVNTFMLAVTGEEGILEMH